MMREAARADYPSDMYCYEALAYDGHCVLKRVLDSGLLTLDGGQGRQT
jgi:hypothetical protein